MKREYDYRAFDAEQVADMERMGWQQCTVDEGRRLWGEQWGDFEMARMYGMRRRKDWVQKPLAVVRRHART